MPQPLAGRVISIVSHDFAPDNVGIAPYATDTARWLVEAGASVTVLSMPPHYPTWRKPAGYPRARWVVEPVEGATVVRVPTYVPADPTLVKRLVFEGGWAALALPSSLRRRLHRADLVVGMNPGLFAGAAAAALARRGRVPLLQVVQDVVTAASEQSGMSGAARVKGLLRTVEGRSLRAADRVVVPSPLFEGPLGRLGVEASRIDVVRNWSRVAPQASGRDDVRAEHGWDGRFVVLHTGNMGLKQGLELLAPAIAGMAKTHPDVVFAFTGGGSRTQELREALGGAPNVQFLGNVPEDRFAAVLAAGDALLLHERPTVRDMCVPSKLTTYFASGLPVLACVAPDGAAGREVSDSGGGLLVGGAGALPGAVDSLRADRGLAAELGSAGRRYSEAALSSSSAREAMLRAAAGTMALT